jgi:hypothetical protein
MEKNAPPQYALSLSICTRMYPPIGLSGAGKQYGQQANHTLTGILEEASLEIKYCQRSRQTMLMLYEPRSDALGRFSHLSHNTLTDTISHCFFDRYLAYSFLQANSSQDEVHYLIFPARVRICDHHRVYVHLDQQHRSWQESR